MIGILLVIKIKSDGYYDYNAIIKNLSVKHMKFQNVLNFRHCIIKSFDIFKDEILKDMGFSSDIKKVFLKIK